MAESSGMAWRLAGAATALVEPPEHAFTLQKAEMNMTAFTLLWPELAVTVAVMGWFAPQSAAVGVPDNRPLGAKVNPLPIGSPLKRKFKGRLPE